MRKPSPTSLAAAVAIALFTHAADAQTRAATNAGRTNAGVNATAPSPANAGITNTASGVNTVGSAAQGGTINPNQGSGTVVLGSTSAGNVVAVGTPIAGVNATGTNPNPNAAQGQTSAGATGNNATGTSQGQTSGTGNGSTSPGVTPSSVQNLQGAQLLDTQGRVLTDANGQPLTFDSRGMIGVAPVGGTDTGVAAGTATQVVVLNPGDLAGSVTSSPELDRATRKEADKAKAASRSRNKQLLNTIAPRTNVDRTDQMADDPPSPALSTPSRSLPGY